MVSVRFSSKDDMVYLTRFTTAAYLARFLHAAYQTGFITWWHTTTPGK
jgi:hypothetical protein